VRQAWFCAVLLSAFAAPASTQSAARNSEESGNTESAKPAPQQIVLVSPRVLDLQFEGAAGASLAQYVTVDKSAPLDLRDVRDSVRALHGSGRFSRVSAYAEDVRPAELPDGWSAGVRVIFVLQPIQKLMLVTFPGHEALPDGTLHATANLAVNAEYSPDAVPRAIEAIQAAYYRIGYREVSVHPNAVDGPDGVQLALTIHEGPATRVASVTFTGQLGLSADQLATAFQLEAGDILNLSSLDDGLRLLRIRYRSAGYLRARVGEPIVDASGGRARIKIPVESGAPVRFVVRGNRSFPSALLSSKLELTGDEPLDAQSAQDLSNRLRSFYVQNGFYFARSSWREQHLRDGTVELAFAVDEGARLRIEQIDFTGVEGVQGVDANQLRELVLVQLRDAISADPAYGADMNKLARSGVMGRIPAGPSRIEIDADSVYDPSLYSRARGQMTDLFKSLGYLSAKVDTEQLLPLDNRPLPGPSVKPGTVPPLRHAKAVIPVTTGLQTTVAKLIVEGGSDDVLAADTDAVITLRTGKPFSYLSAEEGRTALSAVFTKRGYFYCKVEDEEQFNDATNPDGTPASTVEVRYRIQPGPKVRVAYVEVTGEQHTKESLILSLVNLKNGDLLTPEAIDKAQQTLLLTGLFFSATLTPLNPEVAEPEKTILVTLRERSRREVLASAGFSYADGPRAQVQWTQGNLGGRNLTFSALGRVNFPYSRYQQSVCTSTTPVVCTQQFTIPGDPLERLIDLGLSIPRLDPLTDALRASLDLIHQRAVQYTYNLTKYSAQVAVGLNRARPFGVSLAYEVGFQELSKGVQSLADILAGTDQRIFLQPDGNMIFGSLRPTITLDLRDDPGIPRRGFYAQLSADYLRSLVASSIDVNLLQIQGLVAAYVPLPLRSSILFRGRVGRVYILDPSNPASVVPGDRRLYLGGAASLRGFFQDALQPQDLRDDLRGRVKSCNTLISGVACTTAVEALQAGAASSGGKELLSLGAELRVPFYQSVEVAFFYDAGNIWFTPVDLTDVKHLVLRDAVGVGLRYGTPIGRLAVDVGFNLNPDTDLGEPRFGFYFNIDTL
jgi:outer membrane protein insertion porin family